MGELKSAWELASERVIVSKNKIAKEEVEEKGFDFIEIPEFSNREDRVIESYETKPLEELQKEKPQEVEENEVAIEEPEPIIYDGKLMEVCWNGHFLDYSGFARMNRTMVFGLSNRNVKVKVDIEPYLTHVNKATQKQLNILSNTSISPTATKVHGVTVPINLSYGGKKIVYTMIETSEKVHKDYSGKLNLCDEIWVATKYGQKIMQNSNVYPPIKVMPLGVDTSRYLPQNKQISFGQATKEFKFLSVFRWSYRKGYDILLKAYMEEFSSNDDVSLVLVSRVIESPSGEGPKKILEDFNGIKEGISKDDSELPHIVLYSKPVHERDMPKIYNSGDAFVLISRGEGFGIPYIEAGACGLPVIASNCSGHSDFLNEENSYLVEPDGFVEAKIVGNEHRMAKLCHFYEDQIFPNFTRDSIEQTKAHMRHVYENYQEAQEKAKKLRNLVVNNYTWNMAVDRVYHRLREIN